MIKMTTIRQTETQKGRINDDFTALWKDLLICMHTVHICTKIYHSKGKWKI